MKLYGVRIGSEPAIYVGTKAEAIKLARDGSRNVPDDVLDAAAEVEEVNTVPLTKDVILGLVNYAGGWVDTARVIARFDNTGRIIKL